MTYLDFEDLERLVEGQSQQHSSEDCVEIAAHTGIISLDMVLGRGFPSGLVEICGEPSTGKTTLVGQIIGHNQKDGRKAVGLVANERADFDLLVNLGIDLGNLPMLSPEMLDPFLEDFEAAVIVIDSISALDPQKEERSAYLFNFLKELKQKLRPHQCVICTSHVRTRRSAERGRTFASGVESANRRFLDLFATRLELRREAVSPPRYNMVVNVLANILAPPGQYVRLPFRMGYGIDRHQDLLLVASNNGVVQRNGDHFYYGEHKLGHGIRSATRALRRQQSLTTQLITELLSVLEG